MSNVKKLKEYLIGDNGYLLNKISNGKVIMLSGEWGSGKTYFWHLFDDSIKAKLDQNAKPNIYISLYGKSSLQEIENEVFTKAYYKSKGRDDNKKDVIEKLSSTFSKLSSYVDEVSPLKVTPVIDFLETLKKGSQENSAEELMKEGLIIAFDDFERKSTLVNLNDLFGFITNLTLQYKATIVIILNDDVFEGKEKVIFTNVKEKTVSKYLKFAPVCSDLLEMIFQAEKYNCLKKNCDFATIQKTFCEVGIINVRILIQVLDNILEWKEKKENFCSPFYLRYFILSNVNFILNHHVFKAQLGGESIKKIMTIIAIRAMQAGQNEKLDNTNTIIKSGVNIDTNLMRYIAEEKNRNNLIYNLQQKILQRERGKSLDGADHGEILANFINENESLIKSVHLLISSEVHEYGESNNIAEVEILNGINDFIETGIL